MTAEELTPMVRYVCSKEIQRTGEAVTAWVLPNRTVEGRLQLQKIRWGSIFSLAQPEDWAPWDAETIQRLEEENLQEREDFAKRFLGEEVYTRFCTERAGKPDDM